ncbi:DUF1345 domain-containing protein [Paenarthrobacter nitroguajacolicus]|uniref:DUF1345 domain-containing protein n=1 Tax=Paenarthrobacter nitroguajacolicus TaxID=211146 RepID=UPI004054833C
MDTVRVRRSRLRFVVMVVAGALAFAVTGASGNWVDAPAVAWAVAALVYVSWVWLVVARLDPAETEHHATSEDPSRGVTDLLILIANLASLAAVAAVIVNSHTEGTGSRLSSAALALTCVGLSWMLVQTLFTLRYAELYYSRDNRAGGEVGGISFNQDRPPQYTDFAYLATSLGMTYQVSDTNLGNHTIRLEALKHSLLSYLFGTVILAVTINLVIGLAQ